MPKEFFVNDGTRLYYAAGTGDAKTNVFEVSVEGGDPVPLPRLKDMLPFDISADGSQMLLGQLLKELGGTAKLWAAATVGGNTQTDWRSFRERCALVS